MLGRSLSSPVELGPVTRNIGAMLDARARERGSEPAFAEREPGGAYRARSWLELRGDCLGFSAHLARLGLKPGDRCAFVTQNGYARLVAELGAMAGGIVSVPIYPGYPPATRARLIEATGAKAVVSEAGAEPRFPGEAIRLDQVLAFAREPAGAAPAPWPEVDPGSLAMIQFTSGSSGLPKGVALTHRNILSQQRALELLWKPDPGMRFLCYLPWHHSFGGLFERFFALHSGGCLAVDDSSGRDLDRLLQNFSEIRPHAYFSVPKIFQEIVTRIQANPSLEKAFFHPELRFVFTAAAPLPLGTAEFFRQRGVPVVEGWGLTETSPCCTLTPLQADRALGVVGFPIPGVEIRLGEEDEIEVRGPNVMTGYYGEPEATAKVLDREGWFRTGDLGEITPMGLRILSRKDRMFKLDNGEKVFPSVIEEKIRAACRYVKHAYVFGSGRSRALALIFPNREAIRAPAPVDCGCRGPEVALADCLEPCLTELNREAPGRRERIEAAVVVEAEPSIEGGELTPSFKLIPKAIEARHAGEIRAAEAGGAGLPPGSRFVRIAKEGDGER